MNSRCNNIDNIIAIRSYSAAAGEGHEGPRKPANESSSLWSSLRLTLFPVGTSKSVPSAVSNSSTLSPLPYSVTTPGSGSATRPHCAMAINSAGAAAMVVANRDTRAAERRSVRVKEDVFKDLSKNAERFSGTLLKAAVLLITIPLAGKTRRALGKE